MRSLGRKKAYLAQYKGLFGLRVKKLGLDEEFFVLTPYRICSNFGKERNKVKINIFYEILESWAKLRVELGLKRHKLRVNLCAFSFLTVINRFMLLEYLWVGIRGGMTVTFVGKVCKVMEILKPKILNFIR